MKEIKQAVQELKSGYVDMSTRLANMQRELEAMRERSKQRDKLLDKLGRKIDDLGNQILYLSEDLESDTDALVGDLGEPSLDLQEGQDPYQGAED